MTTLDDKIRDIRIAQQIRCREMRTITQDLVLEIAGGMSLVQDLYDDTHYLIARKGRTINSELLDHIPSNYWMDLRVGDDETEDKIRFAVMTLLEQIDELKQRVHNQIKSLKRNP